MGAHGGETTLRKPFTLLERCIVPLASGAMSTTHQQKDDDVLADDGGSISIEAMFADAEAELNATLNESIEDVERLNNQRQSEALGVDDGAATNTTSSRRSATFSSTHSSSDDESEDNGDADIGGHYSSFDDNDDDELSLDGEIENLEGLAMEDLAKELSDLDNMLTRMENTSNGGVDIGKHGTTRPAPFEGKGRRARARRARIKREMKAREERAKAKANDLRGVKGEKDKKKEEKKPLKSLGSTSSLGRALAASQAKSSKFDNEPGASSPIAKGIRAKKGEGETKPPNNSVERSEPFQGKGRRARARRAKERKEKGEKGKEKAKEQVETAKNTGTADTIAHVNENGEKREEAAQMQTIGSTGTKRGAENKAVVVAEVLKRNTFPDFSIREALS